jgi:peptidyl-Lys metalloendopeptidase
MMDKVLDFFGMKPETPPVPPLTEFQKANEAMLNESIVEARVMLMQKKAALDRWNADDKAAVKKWMGDDSEATRKMLQERTQRELDSAYKLTPRNFSQMDTSDPDYGSTYAQVYPNDKTHNIQIGGAFAKAPASGVNSRGGTIVHEQSHFNDIGGTKDHKYGTTKAQQLAIDDPSKAQTNADSYEYYIEH